MPYIIIAAVVFGAISLAQYFVLRSAIDNSEAVKLLTEIKVLLMKDQNDGRR